MGDPEGDIKSLGQPASPEQFFNDVRTTVLAICSTWPAAAEVFPAFEHLGAIAAHCQALRRSPTERLRGQDSVWEVAIDLFLRFPVDASDGLRAEFAGYGGPHDVHETTWLTWAELDTTDWQETNSSGTRTRASAAGDDTDWGRVWSVMRILSEVHGAENVRLVVWFH